MCVGEEVAADLGTGIDDDVGEDDGVRADAHLRADDGVRTNVRTFGNLGCGINDSSWMNAGRIRRWRVKESKRAREGVIGVANAQRGGGYFLEIRLNDDGSGAGGAG